MTMRFARAALVACLLGAGVSFAVVAPATPAFAKAPAGPNVSAAVGKLLAPASKLMETDPKAALDLIKQAQALPDQTPFDTYKINEFLGNVAIKMNDHPTAEVAFDAMADSPSLADVTPEERSNTLRIATLLATEMKHYDKTIKYATAFNALGGTADPLVISSLAEAYYYTNDFVSAEATAQKAIAATPAGQSPPRGALEIVFGSQLKQKKQDAALLTLEQIVSYYDDADEWGQIIDSSLGTKGIKDIEGLHIYRLRFTAHASGQPDDFTIPASIAVAQGFPVEGEAMLQAGTSSGKLQATGKTAQQIADTHGRAARDRASIKEFETLAKKSGGDLELKLAETLYGYGRYADSADAARRALQKGGAKMDANEANMVLGEALIMQGDTAGAVAAFNALKAPSPGYQRAQHIWLLYATRKYATAAAPAAH